MCVERSSWLLFNMDALKGIHHVSDESLFVKPILKSAVAKRHLEGKGNGDKSDEESDEESEEESVAENVGKMSNIDELKFGYIKDEQTFVTYQFLNGVSGYKIDYFLVKKHGRRQAIAKYSEGNVQ